MTEKILCFTAGLSDGDIAKGKASCQDMNGETHLLEMYPVTEDMLAQQVGEALYGVIVNAGAGRGEKPPGAKTALPADRCKYRVVIAATPEREQVLRIMRSFKAVLHDPQGIIFAVVTETALSWTFSDYIGHLGEEHESMKKPSSR